MATLLFSEFSGSFAQSRKYGIIAFSELNDHSFFPSPIRNFLLGKVGRSFFRKTHFFI